MKLCKFIFLAAILCGLTANAAAADLMDVYRKGLANDPTFKAARAQWLVDKENVAMSRAHLLPELTASGNITRTRNESESVGVADSNGHYYNNGSGYSLKLTQSIFNFGNWARVWGAQALAKQAHATFLAAEENLLQRVAQAYFNVLEAKDVLSYTKSKKAETERLFIQAKRKYEVGLIAVVDFENARTGYYQAVSKELAATDDLNNQFEKLNEITGVRYNDLDPVKPNFPLLSPNPTNIDQWVTAAKQQNFELIAARYAAIYARENIKVQNAGHMPTLSAGGDYQYGYNNGVGASPSQRTKTASANLTLSVPIFQGGGVVAAARQADYQYQGKLADQEKASRSAVSQTRQTYLGILSNISQIKADLQAITAAKSALRATEANYSVGTKTMADVLIAQANLYDAQSSFAHDEYAYIKQILELKALTGILTVNDLEQINSWLEKKPQTTKKVAVTTQVVKTVSKNKAKAPGSKKITKNVGNKPKTVEQPKVSSPVQAADNVVEQPKVAESVSAAANSLVAQPVQSVSNVVVEQSKVANIVNNADNSKIVVLDAGEVEQTTSINAN
ncbi:MAG: TolC family outer membrane protein [Gammaproteobacteria bacterium]|nr:TolC family outer membrane protein [Gammaproteobacteria bacterium]